MSQSIIESARKFVAENQARATEFATTTALPTAEVATRPEVSPVIAAAVIVGGVAIETIRFHFDRMMGYLEAADLDRVRSELAIVAEESPSTT